MGKLYKVTFWSGRNSFTSTGIEDPEHVLRAFRRRPMFGTNIYTIEGRTTLAVDLKKVDFIHIEENNGDNGGAHD